MTRTPIPIPDSCCQGATPSDFALAAAAQGPALMVSQNPCDATVVRLNRLGRASARPNTSDMIEVAQETGNARPLHKGLVDYFLSTHQWFTFQ